MKKKYLKLTLEQVKRDVIFSSQLMPDNSPTIHEVLKDDDDKNEVIRRLKDDKFFNDSKWTYNLIRK